MKPFIVLLGSKEDFNMAMLGFIEVTSLYLLKARKLHDSFVLVRHEHVCLGLSSLKLSDHNNEKVLSGSIEISQLSRYNRIMLLMICPIFSYCHSESKLHFVIF